MSIEDTPTAPETPPSWFPLPRFTPNTDVVLHAAELRIAIAEKQSKQSACKRTPKGALKKGEEVAFNEAQAKCDEVFRTHAPIVRESMEAERENYILRAKRATFEEFVRNAHNVLQSSSNLACVLGVNVGVPNVSHEMFNERGDPVITLTSKRGNPFKFNFTIDDTLIKRVEVYGNPRHFSVIDISHTQYSTKESSTQIGSCHLSRCEDADSFVEMAWLIEAVAYLCKDVAEHNKLNSYRDYQNIMWHIFEAEMKAYGIKMNQCEVPEPIEKEAAQVNTPTA